MAFNVKDYKELKEDLDIAAGYMLAARDKGAVSDELAHAHKALAIACKYFLMSYNGETPTASSFSEFI